MRDHIGFFQESPNNNSISRVAFFVGIIWSMLFVTIFAFAMKLPIGEVIALFGGLSGPFFALKLIQKPMEVKDDNPQKEQTP
jgi:hypothetical protein